RASSQIDSAVKEVKSVARTDGPSVQANDASLPASQLATLDQAAAMVHKRKRMPERLIRAGRFPNPTMEDGGGKPHLYNWSTVRPVLEAEYRDDPFRTESLPYLRTVNASLSSEG